MALGIKKLLVKAGKGALLAGVGIDLGVQAAADSRFTDEQIEQLKEAITAGVAAGMIIAANGIEEDQD